MLTVPNLISVVRIAMIPVFWALIVDPDTTASGIVLFGVVVATDWVDGTIARRTGQVSELGKVLDPVADRAAIAAGLIALVVRGAFPLWAAVLILARDVAVLIAGAVLAAKGRRIDVRWIGKVATFALMIAIPAVSWGSLDLWPAAAALAVGWPVYVLGIVEYYIAAGVYAVDLRRALQTA
ncbi:MAG TPA: CDP-alcohol phosphatidyltransferase family protein [Actinomycetota bacterium]|nr:CDP-alcohol phosphatidyltransferase family protein [Actinomycetota bacterium]